MLVMHVSAPFSRPFSSTRIVSVFASQPHLRSTPCFRSFVATPPSHLIMASPETEDEDVKKAIAMSLEAISPKVKQESTEVSNGVDNAASGTAFSLASLNRQTMERERLARRGIKREASISPPPSARKAPKLEQTTVSFPSGARLTSFASTVLQDQTSRKSDTANAANERLKKSESPSVVKDEVVDGMWSKVGPPQQQPIQYPYGVVKKTWAFRFDRLDDDIKLEEVLESRTLKTAVLSAFQWDMEWVLSKLKTPPHGGGTKCVFIMQAKEESMRRQMLHETENARSWLRLCFPPMEGQTHCMHSKLMLLFHPHKLRLAIPTANLLPFDWGESGVMENSVFIIDLPRLPESTSKPTLESLPTFARSLQLFLRHQTVPPDVLAGLLNFDFSATAHLAFVHTIGGITRGQDAEDTCLPGLARAVRTLNQQTTTNLQLDFAASSIGSLNDAFLQNLHSAARGEDLLAKPGIADPKATAKARASFFQPTSSKDTSTAPQASDLDPSIRSKIRIYFPTHPTVTTSIAGAAGTICLSRKWFEGAAFPRSCFRDYVSTRNRLLSHNKILYARGKNDRGEDVAWCYVGSANLSESAWGKVVFDRGRERGRVNGRNWECGVLMPVGEEKLGRKMVGEVKVEEDTKREASSDDGTPAEMTAVKQEDSETEDEDDVVATGKSPQDSAAGNAFTEDSDTKNGEETTKAVQSTSASKAILAATSEVVNMDVFDHLVPPPFQFPGPRYGDRRPWYFTEDNRDDQD